MLSIGPCFYSEEFSQVRVNVNIDIIVDIIVGSCFFSEEFSQVRLNVNIVNIGLLVSRLRLV